jgi:hypothetical protein
MHRRLVGELVREVHDDAIAELGVEHRPGNRADRALDRCIAKREDVRELAG